MAGKGEQRTGWGGVDLSNIMNQILPSFPSCRAPFFQNYVSKMASFMLETIRENKLYKERLRELDMICLEKAERGI